MNTLHHDDDSIRVLIADDDEHILDCYREAFGDADLTENIRTLGALDAELFETDTATEVPPKFEIVACNQGDDAICYVRAAANNGCPFDVVILDVKMPPGTDGIEAGSQIRHLDPNVEIVFVTGYSDVPRDELERRVPPPFRLHYFNKPLSFSNLAVNVARIVRAH